MLAYKLAYIHTHMVHTYMHTYKESLAHAATNGYGSWMACGCVRTDIEFLIGEAMAARILQCTAPTTTRAARMDLSTHAVSDEEV
jgi:hypothetical protein